MDDALVVLSKMAEGAPESSEIAYATAIVYYERENMAQALAHFQKIQPDSRFYENALIHMAVIYYKDNAFDEGIAVLEEGMRRLPPDETLSLIPYLSSFYKEKEMTAAAVELIKDGLAIEPENKELLFDLGVIYDRQGKTDLALEQMQAVLALDPDHADALNYIGYTYADQGIRLDEAEAMIKKALSFKPENGYIIDSLGWVYFRKGLLEDALFELQRAAALIPDDPVVLEHLGDIYLELNDPVKALEYYNQALEKKDKDHEALQEKIEALRKKFPELG
jgi:tetratricopeptide (TPR) repeat protein